MNKLMKSNYKIIKNIKEKKIFIYLEGFIEYQIKFDFF